MSRLRPPRRSRDQAEPDPAPVRHVLLVALGVRDPRVRSDFSGLYQMTWPIFLEVVFFGFILTALLERYSPVQLGRTQARSLSNHTIVVGYEHLGMRIVDFLRDRDRPYSVVEHSEAAVQDLLDDEEPIVVVRPGPHAVTRTLSSPG